MTLVEILLFLIFTILVASYFNYFGVEEKDKASTPEIMLMRWGIWIVVLAIIIWGIHYGINSLI